MTRRKPMVAGDGDPRHGSDNGYNHYACRCQACCDAHRIPSSGVATIVRPYLIRRANRNSNRSPQVIKPVMVNYLTHQAQE